MERQLGLQRVSSDPPRNTNDLLWLYLPAPPALKISTIIITKNIFSWTSLYIFQAPLKVSVYWQMREVAHAERGVQNVQVVQTSSENTLKLSPSASLPESDQYHHPRIPGNDCRNCNFCNKKWEKTKLTFLYFPLLRSQVCQLCKYKLRKHSGLVCEPQPSGQQPICAQTCLWQDEDLQLSSNCNVLECIVELETWVIRHT